MKLFKQIDLFISIGLIVFFAIRVTVKKDLDLLVISYFIIGGWQVISMLVHAIKGWCMKKNIARTIYHWIVVIVISTGLLTFVAPDFGIIFYIMLYAAPVMALFYTLMCYFELRKLNKEQLSI